MKKLIPYLSKIQINHIMTILQFSDDYDLLVSFLEGLQPQQITNITDPEAISSFILKL
jgi:hypothetical protein